MTPPDESTLALQLAASIAANRTMIRLHTENNTYGESAPWPAQPPVRPWSVYPVSRGWWRCLAVDLDASRGAADADALQLVGLMRSAGMSAVLVRSGPTGGRHVFATSTVTLGTDVLGIVREKLQARFSSIDPTCLLEHSTIRPPGAPHRNGGISTLIDPAEPADALADLRRGNPPAAWRQFLVSLGVEDWRAELLVPSGRELSDCMNMLTVQTRGRLHTGKKTGGDTTRSGVQYSIALAVVGAGLDFSDLVTLLEEPAHAAGKKFREQGARRHLRLYRDWLNACAANRKNPRASSPNSIRPELAEVGDWITGLDWKGRNGSTDLLVAEALVKIGMGCGRKEITASTRQIAETAQVRRETVERSLTRLKDRGLIRLGSPPRGPDARVIDLRPMDSHYRSTNTTNTRGVCNTNGVFSGEWLRHNLHEAFSYRGLGTSGLLVYSALEIGEPVSPKELMVRTSKGSSSVHKALRGLKKVGLAETAGDGLWVGVERDLDAVAKDLGISGVTEEKKARNRQEREGFRMWRSRRSQPREPRVVDQPDPAIDPATGEILSTETQAAASQLTPDSESSE